MADTVRITLAHHLTRGGEDLLPGTEIEVPPHEARELIAAAYVAGVDPGDAEAVAKALAPATTSKQLTPKAPATKATSSPGE
ncbi:hypothetical protein ACIRBX_25160 [Kitasatospora sp. NPDC096147]|uniref:DUF7210 family protein n=1 Tax=Kitasatospora sp. NPDC096147 TaxID=3364093 RepID=UPI003808E827